MSRTDWRESLSSIVASLGTGNPRAEYPFARIVSMVGPVDRKELQRELERLVSAGKLTPRYRVRSNLTGSGINDYNSILDIPNKVFDDTASRYQQVDPTKDIEIVYTKGRR